MLAVIAVVLFWAAGIAGILLPITAAWKRGESGWLWVVAALLLGPFAGVVWLLTEHGRRAAVRRSGPPA